MGLLGGPRSRSPPEEGRTACSQPQAHGEDSQHGTCPLQPGTFETRRSSSCSEHPSPHTNSHHLLLDSTSGISGRQDAAQCVAECRTGEPQVSQGRESSPAQPPGAKAARQAWGRSCPALPGSAHHGQQVKTNKNPGGTCWLFWGTANRVTPSFLGLVQTVSGLPCYQQPRPQALAPSPPALPAQRARAYPQLGLLPPPTEYFQSQLHSIFFLGVITVKCVYSSHTQRPCAGAGANHAGHDGNPARSRSIVPSSSVPRQRVRPRATHPQTRIGPTDALMYIRLAVGFGSCSFSCAGASSATCLSHQRCRGRAPSSPHSDAFCFHIPKWTTSHMSHSFGPSSPILSLINTSGLG